MAKVSTTGFNPIQDRGKSVVDIEGTRLESARVRWRGKNRVYNVYASTSGTWQCPAPWPGGFPLSTSVQAQVTFTTDPGVVVKAEHWLHLPWGSIKTTEAEFLGSHTFYGGDVSNSLYPGGTCMHTLNILQGSGQASNVSIAAYGIGQIHEQTGALSVTVAGQTINGPASLDDGVVSDWYSLPGMALGQNELAHSIDGSAQADVEVEYTVQPLPKAPERHGPEHFAVIDNRTPPFEMTLLIDAESDTTVYWPKLTLSRYPTMLEPTVYDASATQAGWEYLDGVTWKAFAVGGVAPGTRVRFTPTANLSVGNWFWVVAAKDDWDWGIETGIWLARLVLSVDALEGYALAIESVDYPCVDLEVTLTCNGEIGTIRFIVNNLAVGGLHNNERINYGDTVDVSIYDDTGTESQYRGRVWQKTPGDTTLEIVASLGDKVLADRLLALDYASQDVGLTLSQAVTARCAPILTTGIPNPVGVVAALPMKGKQVLEMCRELMRIWGLRFWVQTEATDWVMYLANPTKLTQQGVLIRYGDGHAG